MRGVSLKTAGDMRAAALGLAGAALALTAFAVGCAPNADPIPRERARFAASDLSDATLTRIAARMDPAMRALALRHDPGLRQADLWNRPEGWASLDIDQVPDLGLPTAGQTAEELNELRPFSDLPIRPMKPFILKAGGEDRARALQCLTEAVYYEAAREPGLGQEAVAQVVLNRVRHPAYPKSVCGVVYQGSARATGCQFTFTCDGSLRWAPEPALWRQARRVAERALNGHVAKHVGSATHYHAAYVAPYWAPTLVKMTQVGAHIFYRWTGPWGEPPAFTGRYSGREAYLTPAILGGVDQRTQGGLLSPERQGLPAERKVTLAVAGEVRTYTVADPSASGGERTRVQGVISPARRKATPDEIKDINEKLEAFDKGLDKPAAAPAPTSAPPA
ncbi:cell wall hydrolase [Phenylobacterium sp.]|uniref:cell wall hydrolase n=1 Tax=Phenylobacterium sp. TaxID=1871053 RepID=UPI00281163C7|nr:cell wall hydrolase [Phenylobacterium sp.]